MVSPHFNSVRMGHVILWSMADFWWSASGHRLHKSMTHFRLTTLGSDDHSAYGHTFGQHSAPAPTPGAGSIGSQDHASSAHTIPACGCNRTLPANSPTRGRETRALVGERNRPFGSSLRHSVRDHFWQTRPLVAESIAHLWQRETHTTLPSIGHSVRDSGAVAASLVRHAATVFSAQRSGTVQMVWVFPVAPCSRFLFGFRVLFPANSPTCG